MIKEENKMKEKRLHFVWKILIFSLFLFAVAGCAYTTETNFPACERMVPGFTGKGTVAIENMQPHEKMSWYAHSNASQP